VASFPWEWLARIFASEIGFRTAGVGLDRRVANIDCTVSVKTIISQDVSGRWERNVRVNYCTHCSRGTTRKCSRWRGDGASTFAACQSINPVVAVCRVVSGLRLVFGRDRKLLLDPLDFLRRMLPEETLDVRRKFAEKISNRVRAQSTTKAIHGVPKTRSCLG
jgi:hypothetical protein